MFRRIAAGTHADLLTIEREWDEKKKRLKKQIAVDSVREIPRFLQLTPAEGGWRAVIIDGAEDVNPASANALLKILEEPPARAVLILVCNAAGRLLPTLRSRCRHLALSPLSDAAMRQALAQYLPAMDEAERQTLIALAEGSPGRALSLAADGGLAIHALVQEALSGIPLVRAYEFADRLRDQAAFETFMGLLRAAIARAVTATLRATAAPGEARLIATPPPRRLARHHPPPDPPRHRNRAPQPRPPPSHRRQPGPPTAALNHAAKENRLSRWRKRLSRLRERKGPSPEGWEGEGVRQHRPPPARPRSRRLQRLHPSAAGRPFPDVLALIVLEHVHVALLIA